MDDSENPNGPFYQRFSWDDGAALAKEIEKTSVDLAVARQAGDEVRQIQIASSLGNLLTTARQEPAAIEILEWALPIAQRLGDQHEEAGVLLYLATARQYLGQREEAQAMFEQALECRDGASEHFIQHHRGRCFAEQGKIGEARLCFERALHLRRQMNEPRAESSQRALDELETF